MVQLAGCGEDNTLRRIFAAHIIHDRLPRHAFDQFRRSQNRAAHRLIGERGFLEMIKYDVVGGVLSLMDFLDDDGALALQFLLVEGGVLQNIGDNIDRQGQVVGQHLGEIGSVFASRIGVQMAAYVFDFLDNGLRRAALRTLEGHMF